MRIGLIGFGSIGERHYRNLAALGERDVTVLTGNRDADLGERHAATWKEFAARAPFDAIFIANETAEHLGAIRRALFLKPKALFVEKPLSGSEKGLEEVNALVKKSGVSFFVGYCMQFSEPLRYVKQVLARKALGQVYFMRAFVGQDMRGWEKRFARTPYARKKISRAGVLFDLVHDINYPAWLLGEELIPKASLFARVPGLAMEGENIAESLLLSKKSRAMVSVHQDYLRIPARRSLEIQGSLGTLRWDGATGEVALETAAKTTRRTFNAAPNDMYKNEVGFFLKQVRAGRRFSNLDEAIRDIRIMSTLQHDAKKY